MNSFAIPSSGQRIELPEGPATMKKRILTIDSQDIVRMGIASSLEKSGIYQVYDKTVPPGKSQRVIMSWAPDVIIVDPYDGSEPDTDIIAIIRDKWPAIPIIVLTSKTDPDKVNRALNAGCSGYLPKHASIREIELAVEAALDSKIYLHTDVARLLVKTRGAAERGADEYAEVLTQRQKQVLSLIAAGKTTQQIANALGISAKTVAAHRITLMTRLGIFHIPGLVKYAVRHGFEVL